MTECQQAPDQAVLAVQTRRTGRRLLVLGIVLIAANLRPAIAATATVLDPIRTDLHLSGTAAGVLTTLPVLFFGLGGLAVPALVGRLGIETTLALALGAITTAAMLWLGGSTLTLFAGTVLIGAGAAIGNVLLPVLVRRDFPDHAGLVSGLYTTALAAAAAIAAAVTVPLGDTLGHGWPASLAIWGLPALAALLIWTPQLRHHTNSTDHILSPTTDLPPCATGTVPNATSATPHADSITRGMTYTTPHAEGTTPGADYQSHGTAGTMHDAIEETPRTAGTTPGKSSVDSRVAGEASAAGGRTAGMRRLLRDRLAWQVTGLTGLQALGYHTTLAWLPSILTDAGVSRATAGLLLSVSGFVAIPVSLVLPTLAAARPSQRGWIVLLTTLSAAGLIGLLAAPTAAPYLWVILLGLGQGPIFPLTLTIIVLRSPTAESTAALSTMAQSIGYVIAATGPLTLGLLKTATGTWTPGIGLLLALLVPQLLTGLAAARDRHITGPPGTTSP